MKSTLPLKPETASLNILVDGVINLLCYEQ